MVYFTSFFFITFLFVLNAVCLQNFNHKLHFRYVCHQLYYPLMVHAVLSQLNVSIWKFLTNFNVHFIQHCKCCSKVGRFRAQWIKLILWCFFPSENQIKNYWNQTCRLTLISKNKTKSNLHVVRIMFRCELCNTESVSMQTMHCKLEMI